MAFIDWWFDFGSGIAPKAGEDYETFARRVTELAYKAATVDERNECASLCESIGGVHDSIYSQAIRDRPYIK